MCVLDEQLIKAKPGPDPAHRCGFPTVHAPASKDNTPTAVGLRPQGKNRTKKGRTVWRCRDAGSPPARPRGRGDERMWHWLDLAPPTRGQNCAAPRKRDRGAGQFCPPYRCCFAGTFRRRQRKSGSSSGQADSWSRRSRMTLKRNLIQTVRSNRRGVSGPARLSGECYTVVTPCAGVAGVIAVTSRARIATTWPRRTKRGRRNAGRRKRPFHTLFSMFFRFVPHCEGFDEQASNCQFVHSRPYQIEMLLPHCRHDFFEGCYARALFESSKQNS